MTDAAMIPNFTELVRHFRFEGEFLDAARFGTGHINDTYAARFRLASGDIRRYVIQRINHAIFKKPEELMHNMERVTGHMRRKVIAAGGDPTREVVTLIPTTDGRSHYLSPAGETWRALLLIENARSYQVAESLDIYYQAARGFGRFMRMLDDFPINELYETIPDFHHTPKRLQTFVQAVEDDRANRVQAVQPEIDFILHRADEAGVLIDLQQQGVMPLRATHNDTKFENVMIDDSSGQSICVVDLDTVMPGFAVFDFGDAVRSGASTGAEDEPDLTKVALDLAVFDRLAQGFLEETRAALTPVEIDHLVFGAKLITYEQAVRFLTDHLNGDIYYKIQRENQNLDRCRTQIKLVSDMEGEFERLMEIVKRET